MPPPLRGPSRGGGWNRLRPADVDPLEAYGLPSKGETRLSDPKTQERYFRRIVERYLAFCTDARSRDELLERFASLELAETMATGLSAGAETKTGAGGGGRAPPRLVVPTPEAVAAAVAGSKDLAGVLAALRKLREAIVATDRADDFACHVYLFCIRLAILAKHPPSYHPAILHLLRRIHRRRPLSRVELHEVAGYRVLDAACRRGDLAEAYHLRCRYKLRSATVDAALAALAHDDWVALGRLLHPRRRGGGGGGGSSSSGGGPAADGHQAKLLEFAVPDLRVHTLKCFGRAYLRLDDVRVLEAATGLPWADLQAQCGVGWERDGDAVVIRKTQPRAAVAATAAAAAA